MKTRVITFEVESDMRALVLAKLGQGNRFIKLKTGLTDGQITYRLNKARSIEDLTTGYRVAWRNGNHPLFQRIMADYSGIIEKEIERNIIPKIEKPTPKIVKVKND